MGEWKEYRGSKIANTQEVIYDLIGISDFEIKLLSYFSAKDPTLFGTIGKSDRYSLISTISGISEIDEIRAKLSDDLSEKTKWISFIRGKIDTMENNKKKAKADLASMLTKRDTQATPDIVSLHLRLEKTLDRLKELSSISQLREMIGKRHNTYNQLRDRISSHEYTLKIAGVRKKSFDDKISIAKLQLSTVIKGTCPTCGQELENEDLIQKYMDEITEYKSHLPIILAEIAYETVELEEDKVKLEANEKEMTSLKSSLEEAENLDATAKLIESEIRKATKDQINYEPLIVIETLRIKELDAEIIAEEAKRDTEHRTVQTMHWIKDVLLKRNGLLSTELAKQAQKMLQEEVNLLTKGEEFSVTVHDDLSISGEFLGRDEEAYEQLSTGQSRVVDTVMLVALNNLFTTLYHLDHGVLGVVVFDEVLSFLNEKYIDLCYNIIQKTKVPKKIVITHDNRLITRFDNSIHVKLSGKASSVYEKSW
jgi:hypothetical protein